MIDKIKARDVSLRHLGHYVSLTQAGVIGVPRRFLLAQVTLGYDNKPRGGTVILLKGGDKVVYRAREWDDVAVEDMPDTTTPEVIVVRDDAGKIERLVCPNGSCAVSDIAEVDQSTRWNRLEVDDGVIGVVEAETNHQHVGYICQHCMWELAGDLDVVWS